MPEWLEKLTTQANEHLWEILGVAFSGFFIYILQLFRDRKKKTTGPPPPTPTVNIEGSTISLRDQAHLNIAAGDINIQKIIDGIDQRDLQEWLEKLSVKDKESRVGEVRQWYEQKRIPANLREALLIVVARIDQEIRASLEEDEQLRKAGQSDLAEMLDRLNKAFVGGINQLEEEKKVLLQSLDGQKMAVHEKEIAVYLNSADKYQTIFFNEKAVVDLQAALGIKESLGQDDAELGDILNRLGLVFRGMRQYDRAIAYFERSRQIREKALGLVTPDTATSYDNLGTAWRAMGEPEKAITFHEKALAIREKVLGPEDPDTAQTYNSLGMDWKAKGNYTKAIAFHEKALAIREKVLGPEDPDTAHSYNSLGTAWKAKRKYDRAMYFHEKALAIREKVLGLLHPDTATSYNNLATVWSAKGEYAKAIDYFEKDRKILEIVLGPEHPDVAQSYNNQGAAWYSMREYGKAIACFEKACQIREKVLDPDSPDTARSLNDLGVAWYANGNNSLALLYLQRALVIFENTKYPKDYFKIKLVRATIKALETKMAPPTSPQ